MAEQNKSIFRKEALDRVSSPEEYDHYLQVTGPGIWMTLGAVIVILIGAFVWAVFGKLNTTINVPVVSANQQVVCMIPVEKMESVDPAKMKVKVAEEEYQLVDTARTPQLIDETTDISIKLAGGMQDGSFVQVLDVDGELAEGIYTGVIQVEAVSPISFILN